MFSKDFFLYLLVMAGVTYVVRMLPFTLVRGKIKSTYIQSFLFYVPYAVLGAMTFPYIFYSTGNYLTAAFGTLAAFILSLRRHSLIVVAATAVIFAYLTGVVAVWL